MKNNKTNPYLEEIKEEILAFFAINGEQAFSQRDLFSHYDIKQRKEKILYEILIEELISEGKIQENTDGKLSIETTKNVIIGKVDYVNQRFAFIRHDPEKADIWVDADDLNTAMDGDTVEVVLLGKFYKKGENPEGRVTKIVARGKTEIVGKVTSVGTYALVSPDSRRIYDDIFIEKSKINGATKNDKVLVKILEYPTKTRQAIGEITEILGKAGENNAEMHAIMAEFGLPVKFPEEVLEAANAISETISESEILKRRDMRNILTFTIDPADAKDFDDAISYQVLENGNYEIGIHIADVSHYLQEGTILEAEAYRRATSVYLVDRTIPMLPEKLSNNLCSLRPNEDKLTFSAIFEMDSSAKIITKWFGRTIIHSDKRFSYEDAQLAIDNYQLSINSNQLSDNEPTANSQQLTANSQDYGNILTIINDLAKHLRKARFAKGAINFETNEVKFQLDENGKPLGVYLKIRKDAHKLIEEFMLIANKYVAEYVFNKKSAVKKQLEVKTGDAVPDNSPTMVYRVHEAPNADKMGTFAKFAGRLGFTMNMNNVARSFNKLMEEIEGSPLQNVLEQLAIRTMSKARYTTQPLEHFGLAFEHYSHFTSPIRRYPDVMAHRLLQNYLDGKPSPNKEDWELKCKHSSDQEKLAAEAERASIKYKQVEFMSLYQKEVGGVPQIFDGVITGVTDFGIFVEITETSCEGMVRMGDLTDDFYELDKENYRVIGRKTGKILNFGDSVKVTVKTTDLEKRSMDLLLAGMPENTRNERGMKRDFPRGERKSKNTESRFSKSRESKSGSSKDKGKRKRI